MTMVEVERVLCTESGTIRLTTRSEHERAVQLIDMIARAISCAKDDKGA